MTLATLVAYLFGSERAIRDIVQSRRGLLLGLLFVLSAGFAREYDGEDLLSEPWHLLIPLGASLVSSFVLYCLVAGVAKSEGKSKPFWQGYMMFLALFWMTAPLAWLYAIPVERFYSAADSVRANLWLLGIVAAWRVVLITCVISVLYRCRWLAAFFIVMLFSDAVLWVVLVVTPMPILSIMGGIRLTESEGVLLGTQFMLRILGTLSAPIWLFGTIAVLCRKPSNAMAWERLELDHGARSPIHATVWVLSGASLLVWAIILPTTQPPQANRHTVESLLSQNDLADALRFMSARQPDDFPPHWDPPPRVGYGEDVPDLWKILALVDGDDVAPWVRAIFKDKVLAQAGTPYYGGEDRFVDLATMDQQSLETYLRLLGGGSDGRYISPNHRHEIEFILQRADDPDHSEPIPEWRRELLNEILRLAASQEATESPAPAPADAPAEPAHPAPRSDAQ